MRPRTILLIALAALAVGFLVRGVVRRESPPAPEAVPGDALRPRAARPQFGMPSDQPHYVLLGRDEFARWYRAHAPQVGLPEVADDGVLGDFAADVVEPLGRIPRLETLRMLLAEYLPQHAALREIEIQWRNGARTDRSEDPGIAARAASAKRAFFDRLYPRIAYSDLLLLARSSRWEFEDVPPPPTGERPAGGDPYAGPVPAAILEFERSFAPWYLGYRYELDLPERDVEFLDGFQWEVLQWLGRVPKPDVLRILVEAYTPLSEKWRQRTLADRDRAVQTFFATLRRRLSKTDYKLLAGSVMWSDDCERLDIPID